jgi:excinuclease ABC subunit C
MTRDPKRLVSSLPGGPGIYRMLDEEGAVLYVGKALNLKKRVQSYFRPRGLAPKVAALMRQTADLDITRTRTEGEALLLEHNLIRQHRPRFNILLRDDKSYPYIHLSDHAYPRLAFYRGSRKEKGRFYGPYPSGGAVREALDLMQKVFRLRTCEDTVFRNRSRPCLQHQIGRCTAPCVRLISPEAYAEDVRQAESFLRGRASPLIDELTRQMERASARHEYEAAADLRDRIAALREIQQQQIITTDGGDADAIALVRDHDVAGVAVVFVRGGRNLGSKVLHPRFSLEQDDAEALAAFLPQYYLGKPIPPRVYVNVSPADRVLLEQVFSDQAGGPVRLLTPRQGVARRWVEMAAINARDALQRRAAERAGLGRRYESLQEALKLEAVPERLECFDISHTFGEAAVAACVVFDRQGPVKADYRRYNLEGLTPGDDYGALRQALTRRFRKVAEGEGRLPDILFIDGGKGQVAVAREVLEELGLAGVRLIGVAKGRSRKPGREQLFLSGSGAATILPANSPALHLIQSIRDEAHRFAIHAHRARRAKSRTTSPLEGIPGIGPQRRRQLLRHFGGQQGVVQASVDDLARVPGISRPLAQRIYDLVHE